ncbi:MAG: MAPEG family protein [Moraxellaceae bacterium]|nr:MAPEG family protein [Moraxellaceae bacterium]MDZ4385858.1 MAPEG family protein [Moraxellaceae bacterium]
MHSPILAPVVCLVAWSMVMWTWMYVTRLPAMGKAKMKPDPFAPRGEQMNQLPAEVRWKADNYNHLMEQPTLFYAITLALALLGQGDGINLWLAWAYVVIRVLHSLLQSLVNKIELRFVLFFLSSLALIGLTANALLSVF